jgi:hypothetical protein
MDLYALDKRHERQSPLLTIDSRIPKLEVAGSNPVSRSILSIVYGHLMTSIALLNALTGLLPTVST